MQPWNLSLRTLSVRGAALRIDSIQESLRTHRPTRIPAAAEERSMGRQGGGICAANAPRPAGRRERPRGAAPCRSTTATLAKPAKTRPIADRKTDSKLPGELALLQDHLLQTWLAIPGQSLPRRLRDEPPRSTWKPGSTLSIARANPDVLRDLGSTNLDNGTHGP